MREWDGEWDGNWDMRMGYGIGMGNGLWDGAGEWAVGMHCSVPPQTNRNWFNLYFARQY